MEFENRNDVKEDEYIEMIRLKTAVLLAASLKMGALSGGSSEKEAQALYDFGINIGLAFQLKDDLLDVYGDESTFGKNIGGDICCNKKTYLLINAINGAKGVQKVELEEWLSQKEFNRREKVTAVTSLYNQLGLKEKTEQKLDEYYQKAIQCLDTIQIESSALKTLYQLAERLMFRES